MVLALRRDEGLIVVVGPEGDRTRGIGINGLHSRELRPAVNMRRGGGSNFDGKKRAQ